jgi:hypothetical protein
MSPQQSLAFKLAELFYCKPKDLQQKLADPNVRKRVNSLLNWQIMWTTYKNRAGDYKRIIFYDGITLKGAHQLKARGSLCYPYNCNIVQYYLEHHKIFLKYPFLPCVQYCPYGNGQLHYYPLELLVMDDDKLLVELDVERVPLLDREDEEGDDEEIKEESKVQVENSVESSPLTKAENNGPPLPGSKACILWKKTDESWKKEEFFITICDDDESTTKTSLLIGKEENENTIMKLPEKMTDKVGVDGNNEINEIAPKTTVAATDDAETLEGKTKCAVWKFSNGVWEMEHVYVVNWHLSVMGIKSPASLGSEKPLDFDSLQSLAEEDSQSTPGAVTYFLPSIRTGGRPAGRSFSTVYKQEPNGALQAIETYIRFW